MKWSEVPGGTKFEVVQDLYNMEEIPHDAHYSYRTKAEIDAWFTLAVPKGTILTWNPNAVGLIDNLGNEEVGMCMTEEVDLELWKQL